MKWEDLNTQNRAELIKLYVRNGVTSLDKMKEHYNSFGGGGSLDTPPGPHSLYKSANGGHLFDGGGHLFQNGGDKGKKRLPRYDYRQQMLDASMVAGMSPYTSETTRYDDTYADYEAERRKEALEEAQRARQKAADQREWERKQAKEAAKRQAKWATEAEKKRWEDQRRSELGSVAGDALFGPRQQDGREHFQGEFNSWTPEQQQNYMDAVEASGKKDQLINTTQRDLEIMADRYGQALGSAAPMPVEAALSNPVTAAAAGSAAYMAGLGLYEAAPYVWKGVKTAVRNPMSILETAGNYMSPSTYTNALGFSPMVGNVVNSAMALEIGKQSLQNLPKDAEAMARGKDGSALFKTGMDVLGLLPYYSMFKQVDGALSMVPRMSSNLGIVPHPNSLVNSAKGTTIITKENAASIIPEQWTAAQDAAIARGDMAEAQRLRDLHFKVSAPNTKLIDAEGNPLIATHGTNKEFNSFELYGPNVQHGDPGDFGFGHYFYPYKTNSSYGNRQIYSYLNIEKPYTGEWSRNFNRGQSGIDYTRKSMQSARDFGLTKMTDAEIEQELLNLSNADGVFAISPYSKRIQEVVVPKGEQIKSADAVTYDNNGVRIPLGKRDNFNINDVRYSWLPPIIGLGTLGTLYGTSTNK